MWGGTASWGGQAAPALRRTHGSKSPSHQHGALPHCWLTSLLGFIETLLVTQVSRAGHCLQGVVLPWNSTHFSPVKEAVLRITRHPLCGGTRIHPGEAHRSPPCSAHHTTSIFSTELILSLCQLVFKPSAAVPTGVSYLAATGVLCLWTCLWVQDASVIAF